MDWKYSPMGIDTLQAKMKEIIVKRHCALRPISIFILTLLINLLGLNAVYAAYYNQPAYNKFGLALGYGFNYSMNAARLSFQMDSGMYINTGFCPITGYWEGSAIYIFNRTNRYDNIRGGSVSYVAHVESEKCCRWNLPYFELGLGVAAFNGCKVAERNLGSNALIEMKTGLGMRFGKCKQFDISYKFIHYSNGSLNPPNDAINLNFIVFSYLF